MEIWLKQGSKRLRIPVLASDYKVTSSQINTTVNINALGEVSLKGKRGLQGLTFSSFFPYRYDSSYCEYSDIDEPMEYVRLIEKMKRAGNVKVIITGTIINMDATIEKFDWGEDDGTGDVSYTLELKEYRKLNIPTSVLSVETAAVQVQSVSDGAARSEPEQTSTTTYEVKQGDCLSTIAKKMTGSSNWRTIYEQNKDIIGGNPNLIKVGMVLTIPGAKS